MDAAGELLYERTVKVQQRLGLLTESDIKREQDERKGGNRKGTAPGTTSTNADGVCCRVFVSQSCLIRVFDA